MARTQSVSDEAILEAARRVMNRNGYDAFTMSEVAQEVGLSRAAIILRFQSTHALRVTLTTKMVNRFVGELEALPVSKGGDGLLAFARFIGACAQGQSAVVGFMVKLRASNQDPELAAIEQRRFKAYFDCIAARMPKTSISRQAAVDLFQAHIGGSLLRLESEGEVDAADFLEERTKDWLNLARIPFTAQAPKPRTKQAALKRATGAAKPAPLRRKSTT